MGLKQKYDIVVVGAGHAGCEAAHAAAKMGFETLLVTLDPRHVALMSCNPSIGGLAKGHLVREIDALGGVQAIATDAEGIQFRILNTRKGPAVQAPRAQCDKAGYNHWMREFIGRQPRLTLVGGMARDLDVEDTPGGGRRVSGVVIRFDDGREETIGARAVICCTGTFLDAKIHIGLNNHPSGRLGEQSAVGLGEAFAREGLETGRLKTGTPPRLLAGSIDWAKFDRQSGDDPIPAFSFSTRRIEREQVCCWVGFTNEKTHEIIRGGLDRSPLYTGVIEGVGPRYCPSIEDKVVRFPHKDRHQIFLEPEGLTTDWIYPNGLPTSLPEDVQDAMLRSIPGLENVEIIKPGYAVEYTYCPPHQLRPSLETRVIGGLFFAGQLNGTSGYEEAAAQGLMAGINAALGLRGAAALVLRRDEAYLGVLIDDLITMDHREPYRMFTSRAEYRLLLRHDTADLRLTPHGRRVGLIDDERWTAFEAYRDHVRDSIGRVGQTTLNPRNLDADAFERAGLPVPDQAVPLGQYFARPEIAIEALHAVGLEAFGKGLGNGHRGHRGRRVDAFDCARALSQIHLHFKYLGYIRKQEVQIERMRRYEDKTLPEWIDYDHVHGLRQEAREKLARFRPSTLGQAGRVAGINQTDLSLVLVHLKARRTGGQ